MIDGDSIICKNTCQNSIFLIKQICVFDQSYNIEGKKQQPIVNYYRMNKSCNLVIKFYNTLGLNWQKSIKIIYLLSNTN